MLEDGLPHPPAGNRETCRGGPGGSPDAGRRHPAAEVGPHVRYGDTSRPEAPRTVRPPDEHVLPRLSEATTESGTPA